MQTKVSSESVTKGIRRRTRTKYSSEEKIYIVAKASEVRTVVRVCSGEKAFLPTCTTIGAKIF